MIKTMYFVGNNLRLFLKTLRQENQVTNITVIREWTGVYQSL